jgi:flagellar hook-basal body complex protein FliE
MTNISNINNLVGLLNQSSSIKNKKDKDGGHVDFAEILNSISSGTPQANDSLMNTASLGSKSFDFNQGANSLPTDFLVNQINGLNKMYIKADKSQAEVAAGYGDPLQATMDVNKADMNFKLMMEVRNKAIGALKEVLRIQV